MGFKRQAVDFYFQDKHQAKNIGKKSIKAYLYTTGTNVLKFFINIATVSILARLLVPEDFGYVAMAAAFVSAPKIVLGQQLSIGVVQHKTIERFQLNAFFWLISGITIIIAAASFSASPLVAWFFEEPRLTRITRAMTAMVLFAGLSAVHGALLVRTMQFGVLAGVDLIARIISKIVAILLAVAGMGYWALVFMPVSYECARMIGFWVVCSFRPGFYGKGAGSSKSLMKVGSVWSVRSIFSSLISELDTVIIGKFLSSQALGFYSRSFNLAELPGRFIAWPLSSIVISALSRLQDDKEKFKRFFFTLTEGYLFVFIPILMLLFLSSDHVVLLILGNKWTDMIPIFQGLIPLFLLKNIIRPVGWFLTAASHSNRHIKKIAYSTVIANAAFAVGVIGGLPWGIMGIVYSMVLFSSLSFIISVFYVFHGEIITPGAFINVLWRPLTASLAALGVCFLVPIEGSTGTSNPLVLILVNSLAGALVYLVSFLCLPNGKKALVDVIVTARDILRKKTSV